MLKWARLQLGLMMQEEKKDSGDRGNPLVPSNLDSSLPEQIALVEKSRLQEAVDKAFDEQSERMQILASVAHGPNCDIWDCRKTNCYEWKPDKIVSKTSELSVAVDEKGERRITRKTPNG